VATTLATRLGEGNGGKREARATIRGLHHPSRCKVARVALTLGDLLRQPEFNLELVVGSKEHLRRSVAGAHAVEVANPTRWLDSEWVLLTTGIRLRADAAAQREVVEEAATRGLAAIGFALEVIYRRPPAALLEEAARRNFPVFTVPIETPFREIIGYVDRSLASTDFQVLKRTIAIQNVLTDALLEAAPEQALVRRLGSLIESSVLLYHRDGRIAASTGEAPPLSIWRELRGAQARLVEFQVGRWFVVAHPVSTGEEVRHWLAIATRRRHASEELARPVIRTAARLLAVVGLAREAVRADERALRAELVEHLLDPDRTGEVSAERLRGFGFAPGRPSRVALVDLPAPAGTATAGELTRVGRLVEGAAERESACLVAVRRGRLTLVFQERDRDLEDWIARVAPEAPGLRVGVGRPFALGESPLASLRDAGLALDQLCRVDDGRRSLRFEDLGLAEWLLTSSDTRAVETKAASALAPLLRQPSHLRTLEAYLDNDLDVGRAAAALHLHPNSLRYRLSRVEAALGRSLRDLPTVVELFLAVTAARDSVPVLRDARVALDADHQEAS
jgi:purine catabolism regulator